MKARMLVTRISVVLAASALTALTCTLDLRRTIRIETEMALHWTRQVSDQVERLTLEAQKRGETLPLSWAIRNLNQGSEFRPVRLSKIERSGTFAPDAHTLDRVKGVFEFERTILPDAGEGVKIQISLGYIGFFGAKTRLGNDLSVLVLFALYLFSCGSVVSLVSRLRAPKDPEPENRPEPAPVVVQAPGVAAEEFKSILKTLGLSVRDLLREAQGLVAANGKSAQSVGSLRQRIHDGLTSIHDARAAIAKLENLCRSAEAASMNAMVESTRAGLTSAASKAEDAARFVQQIRAAQKLAQESIRRMEIEIEPWATDADLAFHSHSEGRERARKMDGHISRTTGVLVEQARKLKQLA